MSSPPKRIKSAASESAIHSGPAKSRPSQRPLGPAKSEANLQSISQYTWDAGFPGIERLHLEHPEELKLEDALDRLVAQLPDERPKIVAFDMEWVVYSEPQRVGRTALIQVASESFVILYGLSLDPKSALPNGIARLLARPDIIKVGNKIEGDTEKLYKDFDSLPSKFESLLDLSRLTRNIDPNPWRYLTTYFLIALSSLARKYLGMEVKGKDDVRLTNWEARGRSLTPEQLDYASADVTVSLHLAKTLIQLGTQRLRDFELSIFLTSFSEGQEVIVKMSQISIEEQRKYI